MATNTQFQGISTEVLYSPTSNASFQGVSTEVLYSPTSNASFQGILLEVLFLNPFETPPSTLSIRQQVSVSGQMTIGKRD